MVGQRVIVGPYRLTTQSTDPVHCTVASPWHHRTVAAGFYRSFRVLARPSFLCLQRVSRGQQVGLVGSTGRVTGSHVTLRVSTKSSDRDGLPARERRCSVGKALLHFVGGCVYVCVFLVRVSYGRPIEAH